MLLMANLQSSFSQSTKPDVYQVVLDKIKSTYNTKDYKGFYDLLSPNFKSQQSESDIKTFLKDNVYTYYGNIESVSFIKEVDGFNHYKTILEKGNLEMLLACNEKNEIAGFTFLPMAAKPMTLKNKFTSDNKKQTKLDLKIDSIVTQFMSNPVNAGLSIGIIQDNNITYYHYGENNKESKQMPDNFTIYEIGSISKTFTGLLLANAIIDKKINLDEDIRKYLPKECAELNYHGTPITIKHLVTHTSRIPRIPENIERQPGYNELNPYKNYDKKMVYSYLSTLKLDTIPGIIYDYSNTGVALLGMILETVCQQSYEELLEKYITTPLNMKHTFVNVPSPELINFAQGYNGKGKKTPHWDLGDQVGAGGIKSTIADMCLYLNENINESSITLKLAHDLQFKSSNESVALAWTVQATKKGNTLLWHNGGTYGFASFCGFIKDKKIGVVVLSNSGNSVDQISIDILRYLQQ